MGVVVVAFGLVIGLKCGPVGTLSSAQCPTSHEAIYQWVHAQPVATLRRELIALRTGRTRRTDPQPTPAPWIREPLDLDDHP